MSYRLKYAHLPNLLSMLVRGIADGPWLLHAHTYTRTYVYTLAHIHSWRKNYEQWG